MKMSQVPCRKDFNTLQKSFAVNLSPSFPKKVYAFDQNIKDKETARLFKIY